MVTVTIYLPRLELQREVQRVMAALHQVAAVEPQARLLRRLPHVAQLTFPRPRIVLGRRAEPPHRPDARGDFRRDELRRPFGHVAVAGGEDDEVGGKGPAVGERHGAIGNLFDAAALKPYAPVDDELRCTDVDVVARAAAQIDRVQARAILAHEVLKARALKAPIEISIAPRNLVVNRLPNLRQL